MTPRQRDREIVHEYATGEKGFGLSDHQAVGALCRVVDEAIIQREKVPLLYHHNDGPTPEPAPAPGEDRRVAGHGYRTSAGCATSEPYVAGRASGTEGDKTTGLQPGDFGPYSFLLMPGTYDVLTPINIDGSGPFLRESIVRTEKPKTVTLVPGTYNVNAPVEVPVDAPITIAPRALEPGVYRVPDTLPGQIVPVRDGEYTVKKGVLMHTVQPKPPVAPRKRFVIKPRNYDLAFEFTDGDEESRAQAYLKLFQTFESGGEYKGTIWEDGDTRVYKAAKMGESASAEILCARRKDVKGEEYDIVEVF